MPNSVVTTYQVKGSFVFAAKVDIVGDGSGEASAVTIIDPVADLPGAPAKFKVRAIQWQGDGTFSSQLLWDAATDVHAFELNALGGAVNFKDTGANLVNNAGAGITGKLLLTTVGLGSGSKGTILIEGQVAA